MNNLQIRTKFPILQEKVYGKDLVYFDNAATSQRPKEVIDILSESSLKSNANIHRAVHKLANDATQAYESTREVVAEYINARSRQEIIFTSGATAAINLVAFSFGEKYIHEGDEILIGQAEHHSNIVPWQMLCERKKAVIKVLPVDEDGILRIDLIESLITDRTKLLAVGHISNVLGIVNPVKEIVDICRSKGVATLIDGTQGIVHQRIDVQLIGCDFYVFSGHKMYAATGTGVLYGRQELLEEMPPYMGGGEMINTVTFERTTYAKLPGKFEAGTQNINAVPTLKPAIKLLNEFITNNLEVEKISKYIYSKLSEDKRIKLFGVPRGANEKAPIFSFTVKDVHHEDLALILDKMGIAVRSGQMCAEPLMYRFGVTGMIRISIAPYNTMEEAEYFIQSLDKAIKMLL